jgi:hypothetical protein
MVNRRTILRIGAATVIGVVDVLARGDAGVLPHAHHLQRAVYDERFAESRAFAAELKRRGVLTTAIRDDVARLWYEDLRNDLGKNGAPVAGLTDRATLFCLEELARDVSMRVIFRADHVIQKNGRVYHTAVGSAFLTAAARNLRPEPRFGLKIAQILDRAGGLHVNDVGNVAAQKLTGPFSPRNATSLVSWVIA